jgi:hypothetical protein
MVDGVERFKAKFECLAFGDLGDLVKRDVKVVDSRVYPYNYGIEYAPSTFDIKHNFVVSYNNELPFAKLSRKITARRKDGHCLESLTASGVAVTFASFGDNALVYVQEAVLFAVLFAGTVVIAWELEPC